MVMLMRLGREKVCGGVGGDWGREGGLSTISSTSLAIPLSLSTLSLSVLSLCSCGVGVGVCVCVREG